MGLALNNNVASLTAQNNLSKTNSMLSNSLEKLSTGLKVNRGADGPAALVISEQQRAQIAGLRTAMDNTNKAVAVVQTAEGALNEVNGLLGKVRGLALDSANSGVNDSAALSANQAEIKNALETISRIANTTKFGTKNLLNGQAGFTAAVQEPALGIGSIQAGTSATTGALAVKVGYGSGSSITAASAGTGAMTANGSLTISGGGLNVGENLTVALTKGDNAQAAATKIQTALDNASSMGGGPGKFVVGVDGAGKIAIKSNVLGSPGLSVQSDAAGTKAVTGFDNAAAQVSKDGTVTASAGAADAAGGTFSVDVSGGGLTGTVTVAATTTDRAGTVKAFQDALDQDTANGGGPGKFTVQLDGSNNITIKSNIVDAAAVSVQASNAASTTATGFANAAPDVGNINETGSALVVSINGQATSVATGSQGLKNEVNFGGTDGITFNVNVSNGATAAGSTTMNVSDQSLVFQIGANSNETAKVSINKTTADQLGTGVSGLKTGVSDLSKIDVTTQDGAQDAIKVIDKAISEVSTVRGKLGAFQANTLQSNANNLTTSLQNTVAAESVIRDTDFASEIANFTKLQTQMQAGSTVLGNANQMTQLVAGLLRG